MRTIRLIRYGIARFLIHTGLWVMPNSRAKRELLDLLWGWRKHIEDVVREHRSGTQ